MFGTSGRTEHLFRHEVQFVTVVARLGLSERNEMGLPVAPRAFDPQPRAVEQTPVERLFVDVAV